MERFKDFMDTEATAWKANHNRLKNAKRRKKFEVQLEKSGGYIQLTAREFEILNNFMENRNMNEISFKDIEHIPQNVRRVLHDYLSANASDASISLSSSI